MQARKWTRRRKAVERETKRERERERERVNVHTSI